MFFPQAASAFLTISALLLGSPVWAFEDNDCNGYYEITDDRPNEPQSYGKQLLDIIKISYPDEQQSTQRYYEIIGSFLSDCEESYCRKLFSTLLDSENDYPKKDFFYTDDLGIMIDYLYNLSSMFKSELRSDYLRSSGTSGYLSYSYGMEEHYEKWGDNMESILSYGMAKNNWIRSRCLSYDLLGPSD